MKQVAAFAKEKGLNLGAAYGSYSVELLDPEGGSGHYTLLGYSTLKECNEFIHRYRKV